MSFMSLSKHLTGAVCRHGLVSEWHLGRNNGIGPSASFELYNPAVLILTDNSIRVT